MIDKRHLEILERLDAIEKTLAGKVTAKSAVTKADLMKIKGVDSALANEIMKVIKSK